MHDGSTRIQVENAVLCSCHILSWNTRPEYDNNKFICPNTIGHEKKKLRKLEGKAIDSSNKMLIWGNYLW
jgi:hypothetical protein